MQNVEPEHWGASLWGFVHWSAAALPVGPLSEDLKQASSSLVSLLCYILPCEHCRDHFITFVHAFAPNFVSNEDVKQWWLKCHNYINRTLRKPEWGAEQLNKKYNTQEQPSHSQPILKSYPVVSYTKPNQVSAQTFDINQYLKANTQQSQPSQPPQRVLGYVQNGKWKPIQNQAKARTIPGFNRTNNTSYLTNIWRMKMQQKAGAGAATTGLPAKKKGGCKKCGKR